MSTTAAGARRPRATHERPDEVADLVVDRPWIRQGSIASDLVVVPAPLPASFHEPGLDEIGHDRLCGAWADPDLLGELTEAEVRAPDDGHHRHAVA
jgi:hypothetical protein